MNERHPSGYAPGYSAYGYDTYPTVGATYGDGDPLFGVMPGTLTYEDPHPYATVPRQPQQYEQTPYGQTPYGQTYDTTGYWQQPAWVYAQPEQHVAYEPEPQPQLQAEPMIEYPYEYEYEYGRADPELEPHPDPELDQDLDPVLTPAAESQPETNPETNPGATSPPLPRSRRKRTAKRSALLTVAVPSAAVMGVAACAAATISAPGDQKDTANSQADAASSSTVTTKLDQQLAGVSRDADDFATRASRTQERLDLKERQAAEKQKKAAAAAAKEAARPKFLLPVTQKGLSAYFGQAGVNWMSVHTGIDFPVSYGTPVMAATDGTVRTQWNSAYGNMAIVTAPDGTETWYCHLSSTKFRSGSVQAGDVIAYSGDSGNSTGPHLHFEVRPHGGAAIDPLPWLLAKGLDPR
ncbi:M23 family metallopeptidase [Actinacidiphila oryziradicis]|uniref:M23 family peptidase n=1 Tax=Actinacidiphila oryziradicis TaxID=2571141 RepID=A0A4V5N0Q0_9ACTN|nr:M23 family metallopeptidase [Actinacidiphila oryziradicis]TKA12879.1 M23 family peptidase [Actinacidiphila oryziradicis]